MANEHVFLRYGAAVLTHMAEAWFGFHAPFARYPPALGAVILIAIRIHVSNERVPACQLARIFRKPYECGLVLRVYECGVKLYEK